MIDALWHPLTIADTDGGRDYTWSHPAACTDPDHCPTGDIARRQVAEHTEGVPAGEYRMRLAPRVFYWQADCLQVENADGTPLPVAADAEPVEIPDEVLDAMADAADRAVGDANHADLCGCDGWPKACVSGYSAGFWDSGVWRAGLPAALAVLEEHRAS